MDPSAHAPPDMTLSIGSIAETLHRDGAALLKPLSAPAAVQNPWYNSPGLKRKRGDSDLIPTADVSTLSMENDACGAQSGPRFGLCYSASYSPCNSDFSTGSRASTGNMLMRQGTVADEGPPMSLGLGLTRPSSYRRAENGGATSFESGAGRSMVTSEDVNINQPADTNPELGNEAGVLLGLGPSVHCQSNNSETPGMARKAFKQANATLYGSDLGVQLQLGLSRSSFFISDEENASQISLGPGTGPVFADTRVDVCNDLSILANDEGSTSARTVKAGGYIPALVMGSRCDGAPCFQMEMEDQRPQGERDQLVHLACNSRELGSSYPYNQETKLDGLFMTTSTVATSAGGLRPASADRTPKTCKFLGCGKGARGASGLCITHGGGRRCQRQRCKKGAEGCTVYCKAHGGGRRCQSLGCTKSAEGKTEYCIGHGGGRRCSQDGCTKAARGRSGLCIRHGGGKRCQKENCAKSAEGYSGLCIAHGGGRRCQAADCKKGAQGSTFFCKAHGGGKRCMIQGCNKGAEGSTPLCKGHGGGKRCMFDGGGICTKSVHGGTSYCVAHGGGKRCAVRGCTKSARGRTSFCVRHGGGKRCRFDDCTKSAQGSTEFCKAHGGGRRCRWGQEGSPYSEFVKDESGELVRGPCARFARGKIGLCAAHSALVQDRRVHGAGTMGTVFPAGIGPGLFRGLATGGPNLKRNPLENASDAAKQSIHGSQKKKGSEPGSEIRGGLSDLIQKEDLDGRPSEDEPASMEKVPCHARGLPQLPHPRFLFTGNHLSKLHQETQSLSWSNGGAEVPSNGSTGLHPGMMSFRESKGSQLHHKGAYNFLGPSFLRASNKVAVPILMNQLLGEAIVFQRPLLPPQVLVPLSMQKGEFLPSHGKGSATKQTITSNVCDNAVINKPVNEETLHSGSAREELRVHGEGSMPLLLKDRHAQGG